jgi:hypothetical protein
MLQDAAHSAQREMATSGGNTRRWELYQEDDQKPADDPGEAAKHALQEGGRELSGERRVHHQAILHLAAVNVLKIGVGSLH